MKSMKALGLALSVVVSLAAGAAQANSSYCREYTRTIQVGGQPQQAYGTACMQPDGSWQEVTEPQVVPSMNQQQTAFYPVTPSMQVAQPRIPYDYSYAAPVAAVPVIMPTRTVYRDTGTSFSISFGNNGWRNDPYYVHGRYYNPHHWDKHWAHHRKHYKRHDHDRRGRGRGHDRH